MYIVIIGIFSNSICNLNPKVYIGNKTIPFNHMYIAGITFIYIVSF